jgi:hypothetical protein
VTYQFDGFTLDTATRRLPRGAREPHLSPGFRSADSAGREPLHAMSKADLHQKLWSSTYVLDTNLAGLVAELRRELGDAADDPRYIRTGSGFGGVCDCLSIGGPRRKFFITGFDGKDRRNHASARSSDHRWSHKWGVLTLASCDKTPIRPSPLPTAADHARRRVAGMVK